MSKRHRYRQVRSASKPAIGRQARFRFCRQPYYVVTANVKLKNLRAPTSNSSTSSDKPSN